MKRKKSDSTEDDPNPVKKAAPPKRRRGAASDLAPSAPVATPSFGLTAGADGAVFGAEATSLTVHEPANGARKLLHTRVTFRGTATAPVVTVRAFARSANGTTETPLFTQPVNAQGRWEHDREFSQRGDRALRVEGLNAAGDVVASANLRIHLFVGMGGYQPPDDALPVLGNIADLLEGAENVKPASHFEGGNQLFRLPGGALYMVSDLDVDTDGSGPSHGDIHHQTQTSLARTSGGVFVNADEDAYFVLNPTVAQICGMRLGDVAAVIFRGQLAFALYADNQDTKVGEGSMALHAALGHPVTNPNREGIEIVEGEVITILFPGSRSRTGTGYRRPDRVAAVAQEAFNALARG